MGGNAPDGPAIGVVKGQHPEWAHRSQRGRAPAFPKGVSASANRLCNGCAVLHCVPALRVQTRFAALAGDPRKGRGWRGLAKRETTP